MKFKKFIAAVISVAMIISCVNFTAFAEETSTEVTTAAAVKVNEDGYETLANALEKAKAMTGDVTVEIYDKVTLDQNLNGSYSSIKFVGKTDSAEIYIDLQGYVEANGKNVAFENLTLSKSDAEYIYNAGFMNVAFGVYQASSVSYTDCTFANGAYASKGTNTFTKCTFKRSHDKYSLWAYGDVEVIVDNCTFADYRGIKMYAEGAAKTVDLTVKNTDFSAVTDKPAIVLTYGESVTLEGNTYSSTGVFELDLDGAPNGTPVTSDVAPTCKNDNGACGVLVDGNIYTTVAQAAEVATKGSTVTLLHNSTETVKFAEGVTLDKNGFAAENVTATQTGLSGSGTEAEPYLINNLAELKWFRDQVDLQSSDGTTQFTGKYFKLTNDINLDEDNDGIGENWNPIGSMSGDHGSFKGIFDGDGHTISNLYVETAGNGLGLFARTAGNAVIKNLTINNATLKSTDNSNYLGAVVANSYASTKIENVHVTGKLNIEGQGYLGGISGHGYVVMNNCSVKAEGTIESSFWCVGGILGYGGEGATNITNSSVEGIGKGLLLTSAAGGIGSIIGMAEDNNGTQPISGSNLSAKNVDIKTYVGGYGTAYAEYALGYLYGGNPTSKLTGTLEIEDVTFETSTGNTNPPVSDAVASINSKVYFSLADAVASAENGDTIKLLWAEGREPIAMNGAVYGKSITITGDATVDWSKDFLFVGRGGEGNGTVTFDNANLKSASNSSSYGIHVSGREKNTTNKYDGTLIIKNSTIELDYLINKGTMTLDNSTLTVKNGFSIGGRPASETESGEDATATIELENSSKVVVNNHNGMGLGYEAIGIMNIDKTSEFECTQKFLITKKGTMNVNGGNVNVEGELEVAGTLKSNGNVFGTISAADGAVIDITGGTYTQDVSEYVADGYTSTLNADGTYSVARTSIFGVALYVPDMTPVVQGTYRVGIFAGIDSLMYKEVGFRVYHNNRLIGEGSTTSVYKSLTAGGMTAKALDYNVYRFFGIPVDFHTGYDNLSGITFQPYAIDLTGKTIVGGKYRIEDIYTKTPKAQEVS